MNEVKFGVGTLVNGWTGRVMVCYIDGKLYSITRSQPGKGNKRSVSPDQLINFIEEKE